mgnify:CR=1 FL=1
MTTTISPTPIRASPLEGYDALVERLLTGSDVLLSTPYEEFIAAHPDAAWKTVYTGTIDGFFHYCYGPLEYRSLRFETQVRDCPNYQGSAVVNYTAREVPYTRVIEHKHFQFGAQEKTVLTWEYPAPWQPGEEPYYPVNDEKNRGFAGPVSGAGPLPAGGALRRPPGQLPLLQHGPGHPRRPGRRSPRAGLTCPREWALPLANGGEMCYH